MACAFNLNKPSVLLWDIGKQCIPRSDTAKNAASDQGLHCLHEDSIKI